MEKIKPEVIGYNKVYNDGYICRILFEMNNINESIKFANSRYFSENLLHKNGKPKFRLVYQGA